MEPSLLAPQVERIQVIPGARARRARVLFATMAALLYPVAIAALGAFLNSGYYFLFFAPAVILPLMLLRLAPGPRFSQVEIGPGYVREKQPFGLILRARDVTGITTCTHHDGYAMTVQLRRDPAPHTFVVKDEATLARLRAALGGGHDGGGILGWPTQRDQREVFLTIVGISAAGFCMGFVGPLFALAFPFLRAFPKAPNKRDGVMLTDQGLVWQVGSPRLFLYAAMSGASRIGKLLFLDPRERTPATPTHVTIPLKHLSEAEIDVLVSQLNSAIRRAHGDRTLRESAIERVQALKRSASEPIKEWLVRLEAVAAALRGNDYRSAPVNAEDLWQIASDPDETFEDRAAAGRVLIKAQGEDARVRVVTALANAHAPEQRIRVALEDDLDLAANALVEDEVDRKKRALEL